MLSDGHSLILMIFCPCRLRQLSPWSSQSKTLNLLPCLLISSLTLLYVISSQFLFPFLWCKTPRMLLLRLKVMGWCIVLDFSISIFPPVRESLGSKAHTFPPFCHVVHTVVHVIIQSWFCQFWEQTWNVATSGFWYME